MKIVFFETMPGEQELLQAHLPPGHEVVFSPEKLSNETLALASGAQVISIFGRSEMRQPLLDQLPDLKLLTTRTMGTDHIDVAHAKSKGILVNNVQTYASHPVSEFTFALLLAVSRRIYAACHRLRDGTDFDQHALTGFNLFGKTLGVAGTGRIGKNVITIAKGFGMEILAYDMMPDPAFATEHAFTYVTLDELVSRADIITLHTPYTPETHHLIDASRFARMKKGVVIINTARGEIIDTHALLAALRDGTVGGAGLDVLESERTITEESPITAANRILIDLPNVVATPHIAFATKEAMEEIGRATAQTISNFIAGTDQKYL